MKKNDTLTDGCELRIVSCLNDNYAYVIHDPKTLATAVIDAPEAAPIKEAIQQEGWKLTDILITHHHHDHVGGVSELKAWSGCRVTAPFDQLVPIHDVDVRIKEGSPLTVGGLTVQVLETPGHTLEHVTYVLEDFKAIFSGDTLFSCGCGRVFEGTYEMMWDSLKKLRKLPDDHRLFFGHEYTATNVAFSLQATPGNEVLEAYSRKVEQLRSESKPTVGVLLGSEKETNPFLRADQPDTAADLNLSIADPVAIFGKLRDLRNDF